MATQLAEAVETFDEGDEAQTPRDFEAEARSHGWTPKDDFKGDPTRWVDAETFIKRADEVMPLLKKKTQNQDREIAELKRMVKKLTRAEQAAYENALSDLKAQAEAAVESGDLDAYRKVDGKIETLRKEAESDLGDTHGENPQEQYAAFRAANIWYDKGNLASASELEADARAMADRLADKYAAQGLTKDLPPSEFFAKIAREVEEALPLLTAKKARAKPPSAVEGVSANRGERGAKTGANLPPEAKRQAERFFNQGILKGKDLAEALNNYAKKFDWSAA